MQSQSSSAECELHSKVCSGTVLSDCALERWQTRGDTRAHNSTSKVSFCTIIISLCHCMIVITRVYAVRIFVALSCELWGYLFTLIRLHYITRHNFSPTIFWSNDVTSGSLPVTWGQVMSFPVTWLPPPASYSPVGAQTCPNLTYRPSTATSRWLPVKWRHFRVTSGNLRSRDVISCHVTASSCELQPCRKWNAPRTQAFSFLQWGHLEEVY